MTETTPAAARDRLVAHKDALTEPRHGWGISVSALRTGTAGIPTAVVGEAGEEGPVIAILGEYDALPG